MEQNRFSIERMAFRATRWIGSTHSLIFHTIFFVAAFILVAAGIPLDRVLLVLTTVVSLEAIYLSIFIQMSVNRNERRLHAVSKEMDEIQEDIEQISEDVGEIQEDVEQIEKDIEGISEDVEEIQEDVEQIEKDIDEIQEDIEDIEEESGEK